MNIFVLDFDPIKAAQYQCDKHVVKMVLETAQILCTVIGPSAPYAPTHVKHPCTKWAGDTLNNFLWLLLHGKALAAEYTYRYEKIHRCEEVIHWCESNVPCLLLRTGISDFVLAMPEQYKATCPVQSYRNYYLGDKKRFATWRRREPPYWWAKERPIEI